MKKKLLSVLLITALGASLLAGCSSEKDSVSDKTEKKVEEKLTKVTLNEVAHSIFYAPMYVAIEEDYFKDEGIDLELVTGFGVRKLGKDSPHKPRISVILKIFSSKILSKHMFVFFVMFRKR